MIISLLILISALLIPIGYPYKNTKLKATFSIFLICISGFSSAIYFVNKFYFFGLKDDVSIAVSHSAFWGPSKSSEVMQFWVMIVIFCILCYCGLATVRNRFFKVCGNITASAEKLDYSNVNINKTFLIFTLLLNVLYLIFYSDIYIPPIYEYKDYIHPNDFDSQNVIYWQYLYAKGLLPYKDFWFPYAEQIRMMSPLLKEHLISLIYKLAVLNLLNFILYKVLNFSFKKLILFYIVWIIFNSIGYISWTERYYSSLLIYLLFAMLLYGEFWKNYYYIFIGIAIALLTIIEPMQLMAGIPAIFIALFTSYFFKIEINKNALYKTLIIFISIIVIYMFHLYYGNQLIGYYDFIISIHETSNYASFPIKLNEVIFRNNIDSFLIFLIFLNLFILVYSKVFIVCNSRDLIVLLGMNLISLMLYQKNIVRPSISNQIFIVLLLTFFYGYSNFILKNLRNVNLRNFSNNILVAIISIALFNFFSASNFFENIQSKFSTRLIYLNNNFQYLSNKKVNILFKEKYFSHDAFMNSRDEYKTIHKYYGERISACNSTCLYVFGDEPFIYAIFNKNSPYFLSLYNQSPIYDQEKTIQFLKIERPKYVIINRKYKDFDVIPNVIRLPLVYKYIIQNYKFKDSISGYDLLEYDGKFDSKSKQYWNDLLGFELNYGKLYGSQTYNEVNENLDGKFTYKILNINKNLFPQNCNDFQLNFIDGDIKYHLSFKISNTNFDINIPLSNLWFWDIADYKIELLCNNIPVKFTIKDFFSNKKLLY